MSLWGWRCGLRPAIERKALIVGLSRAEGISAIGWHVARPSGVGERVAALRDFVGRLPAQANHIAVVRFRRLIENVLVIYKGLRGPVVVSVPDQLAWLFNR